MTSRTLAHAYARVHIKMYAGAYICRTTLEYHFLSIQALFTWEKKFRFDRYIGYTRSIFEVLNVV